MLNFLNNGEFADIMPNAGLRIGDKEGLEYALTYGRVDDKRVAIFGLSQLVADWIS